MNCGAPPLASAGRFCTFCGAELPSEGSPLPPIPSEVAGARFERLRAIPEALALIRVSRPEQPPVLEARAANSADPTIPLIILIGSTALACYLVSITQGVQGTWIQTLAIVTAVGLALFGIRVIVRLASRVDSASRPEPPEPAELFSTRIPALVVDERISVGAGTMNFATLQGEDGERQEHRVTAALAGQIAVGDIGIAAFSEKQLVEFRRFDA